jgi:hypothetical protein
MPGINLAELQQKVDRLLFNMAEQNRRAYSLFFDPTPREIELPQLDENGNLVTVKIPNRALIKKQLWDDVGKAIGQMRKSIYISREGRDDNPGTSTAPFRTLRKAVESIPVGGWGWITLLSDIELAEEPSSIDVLHKAVEINLNGFTLSKTNTANIFYLRDSYLKFYGEGKIRIDNSGLDDNLRYHRALILMSDTVNKVILGDIDFPWSLETDEDVVFVARSVVLGSVLRATVELINGASEVRLYGLISGSQALIGEVANTYSSGVTTIGTTTYSIV